MRQILVIQLSRVGDLIHTTPLLRELIASDPAAAVDCLTFNALAPLLAGLGLRAIHTLPQQDQPGLHEEINALCIQGRRPVEIVQRLSALQLPFYDQIISCDYGLPGTWLTAHIPARERIGVMIDDRGQSSFNSAWCSFRYGLSRHMSAGRINVVDLWRGMGPGAAPVPDRDSRPWVAMAESLPFALPAGRRVALNPGAHHGWRCWPPEQFALLAENLASAGFVPLLVGAPADGPLAEKVCRYATVQLPNFAGQTSLTEMVRLLSSVELLITNDTGAAHLAAAAATPVLGLYDNIANFAETVPWSAGNLVLNRPGASIFRLGPPLETEVVWQAARVMLSLDARPTLPPLLTRHGVHAWETCFLPTGADPLGGLACVPLHTNGIHPEEFLRLALRHAFAWTLCGERGPLSASFLLDLIRSGRASVAPQLLPQSVGLMRRAVALVTRLEPIAQQARALAAVPDPAGEQAQALLAQLLPLFAAEESSDAIAEVLLFLRKNMDSALHRDASSALALFPGFLAQTTTVIARAMHLMVAVLEDFAMPVKAAGAAKA